MTYSDEGFSRDDYNSVAFSLLFGLHSNCNGKRMVSDTCICRDNITYKLLKEIDMEELRELLAGITTEEMKSLFFDKDTLLEPEYKLYQLNSNGQRYYYRFVDGEPEFYPSVTTILDRTLKQSPFLIKWLANKGMEEAERYRDERAAYGTFMHAQFEKLLIERTYNLDMLKENLRLYIESKNLPQDFIFYADDLKKDMLAFAQFVKDYDVRPLAVEIALVHPDKGYAGMIDLPCTMVKPGKDERFRAIVDFKSGRNGFYEGCELQLHMYMDMWNANYPDHTIERVFNFSPKDWRKKPTYNLKEQTDSPNAKKVPYLLELAKIEDGKKENVFTSINGFIDLDSDNELTDNITTMTLSEIVNLSAKKDERKDNEDGDGEQAAVSESRNA